MPKQVPFNAMYLLCSNGLTILSAPQFWRSWNVNYRDNESDVQKCKSTVGYRRTGREPCKFNLTSTRCGTTFVPIPLYANNQAVARCLATTFLTFRGVVVGAAIFLSCLLLILLLSLLFVGVYVSNINIVREKPLTEWYWSTTGSKYCQVSVDERQSNKRCRDEEMAINNNHLSYFSPIKHTASWWRCGTTTSHDESDKRD